MKIRFITVSKNAKCPVFSTDGSAGADLYAALSETITVKPMERTLIPTGLKIEIPKGFSGFVFPRSSLASKHGLTLANCVGVIDSDYRGELLVSVVNQSDKEFTVFNGDRIAQLVVLSVPDVCYEEATEFTATKRGEGGFGSTGR